MMALRPSIITVIGLIITMATHPLGLTSGRHSTKLEVFVDKTVRGRAPTERGNTRGGTTKKTRYFTHPFIHKSTLLSTCYGYEIAATVVAAAFCRDF